MKPQEELILTPYSIDIGAKIPIMFISIMYTKKDIVLSPRFQKVELLVS